MALLVNLLLWLHFMALAIGIGGGMGMSQVGPRLITSAPDQRAAWWPLANFFSRVATTGLVMLLITGPLLLWLKFDGGAGLGGWFAVKMLFVLVMIVTIGIGHWGLARLRRGDEGGGRLMLAAGPLTMLAVTAVMLSAVLTFN